MRAPKRKRPILRRIAEPQPGIDLEKLASRVSYVASPEHKDAPSFAGQPKPRADASKCDRQLAFKQEEVTEWLRLAIRRGAISMVLEDGFPRYAWHKEDEVVYEARLTNQGLGQYKGYPLNSTEWPEGLDLVYE
jgi:hypothetical protein